MATIRKLKSGKWHVQIRRKGYSPVRKSFTFEKDAYVWIRSIESEMDKGSYINRSSAENTTLADALIRYRNEITPTKKGRDREKNRINQWLKHSLANKSLSSLRSTDFAKYRDDRLKQIAPATLKLELALMSHIFTIAIKEWNIPIVNPISLIRKPSVNNSRTRRLEEGEEQLLLTACKASRNPLLYPIVVIAIETACRLSELLIWNGKTLTLRSVSSFCLIQRTAVAEGFRYR